MSVLHLARRKCRTLAATVRSCSNWPAVALARKNASVSISTLRFRSGLQLRPMPPLHRTWGEVFEPAIADVYGIGACAPAIIVDIGANIGAFACFAAYTHSYAQVHAFEPSARHADLLEANVTLNGLTDVTLHRTPVTQDGREVIFTELDTGGASGIILQSAGRAVSMGSVSLDCVDFFGKLSAFFKLDCEGAEGEIIQWICANLSRLPSRLRLACEYHHWCPIPFDGLLDMLRSHGLRAEHRTPYDESYIFASLGEQTSA